MSYEEDIEYDIYIKRNKEKQNYHDEEKKRFLSVSATVK